MGHKTPSPNAIAGGEKEMREMEEDRRRRGCTNFKYDETAV